MNNSGANLQEFILTLSPERQEIIKDLLKKNWFRNTNFKLQKKLFSLPNDFNGYLIDLLDRTDEIGGNEVLKLIDIKHGNYNIISIFQLRSLQTNQEFTYEYNSYKYGKNPGFKGVLFLEVDGQIKYFIIKKTNKFSVANQVYDSIGGFIKFKQNVLINLPQKVENEIKRELGLKEIIISRFIDLGLMTTDVGMTNNHVALFAAIINVNQSPNIQKLKNKTIDTKKIDFELIIEPIENLGQYIHKVDDSFFLASICRLISIGIIKPNQYYGDWPST